jgi:hypothetical protein
MIIATVESTIANGLGRVGRTPPDTGELMPRITIAIAAAQTNDSGTGIEVWNALRERRR